MTYRKTCAYEGCTSVLGYSNISGVCRLHNHSEVCRCSTCENRRVGPGVVRDVEGQRVSQVRYYRGRKREDGVASVSLPAEPWADEGDIRNV